MTARIADVQSLMSFERAKGLQEAVYYCYGSAIEGDLIEFGTMTGYTANAIGEAMLAVETEYGLPQRRLHLYDSFEGLPEPVADPDVASPHVRLGHWTAGGCKVLGRGELVALMTRILPAERLVLAEGWYEQTVGAMAPETLFGFIHIDCDLYQSTVDALEPLFRRGQVAPGAVICFDDWMCNRASERFGEQRAFSEMVKRYAIRYSPWGWYTWSGARFILHDYRGCGG